MEDLQLSRKLTDELKVHVASIGSLLLTAGDIKMPASFSVPMKLEGIPTDVEVSVRRRGRIQKGDEGFREAAQRFLNRKIDLIMSLHGYEQDGRCYLEKRPRNISRFYCCHDGLYATSRINRNGEQTVIVDPVVQVRSRVNLLQSLKEVLRRKGIKHWRGAVGLQHEINRVFRTKALSLRTTYVELRRGVPQHNTYRFLGFDFSQGLREDSDPINPVNFHRKYGRKFSMDQPIVYVMAKGGYKPKQIPELLEEQPTMRMLKRFGAATDIQSRALMDATDRYFTTTELIQPLIKGEVIRSEPLVVKTKNFGPVILEVEGDYIEVKNNFDFQKIFKKGKLLQKPDINSIHIFSTSDDSKSAKRLLRVLKGVFKKFDVEFPKVVEHLDCPNELDAFKNFLIRIAKSQNFQPNDLVLVVFGFSNEDVEEEVYNSVKGWSITKLFPVQFIDTETVRGVESDKDLRTDVVNLLFLQIVAKCRGKPYGLQPGFAPVGTLFVGLDKYRNPFRKDTPWVTTVTLFDNNGSYVCSSAKLTETIDEADVYPLVRDCFRRFSSTTGMEKMNLVIYLVDTGVGTMEEQLLKDAERCRLAASEIGASYVFLPANKGSHLRLYRGNPSEPLGVRSVSSFTAALGMRDPKEILVVSTEPIIDKRTKRKLGTPKPVLYQILSISESLDFKRTKEIVAKCIVWLCKHSWIAPASTRLPAPLFFANKLSRLVSSTGEPVSPDITSAPLFL